MLLLWLLMLHSYLLFIIYIIATEITVSVVRCPLKRYNTITVTTVKILLLTWIEVLLVHVDISSVYTIAFTNVKVRLIILVVLYIVLLNYHLLPTHHTWRGLLTRVFLLWKWVIWEKFLLGWAPEAETLNTCVKGILDRVTIFLIRYSIAALMIGVTQSETTMSIIHCPSHTFTLSCIVVRASQLETTTITNWTGSTHVTEKTSFPVEVRGDL